VAQNPAVSLSDSNAALEGFVGPRNKLKESKISKDKVPFTPAHNPTLFGPARAMTIVCFAAAALGLACGAAIASSLFVTSGPYGPAFQSWWHDDDRVYAD